MNWFPKTAMVFAAGLGTRMLPLSRNCPKPLIKVAGKTLIDHVLDPLAKIGVPQAIVNKLHKDFSAVLQMPDVRDHLLTDTVNAAPSASPRAFADFLAAETAKWGALVRETGAKAE